MIINHLLVSINIQYFFFFRPKTSPFVAYRRMFESSWEFVDGPGGGFSSKSHRCLMYIVQKICSNQNWYEFSSVFINLISNAKNFELSRTKEHLPIVKYFSRRSLKRYAQGSKRLKKRELNLSKQTKNWNPG